MPVMTKRRNFLLGGSSAALATLIAPAARAQVLQSVSGSEHWTTKKTDAGDVRLFMWRKRTDDVPTGTYIDMSANLPVLDPERITVPTAWSTR